MTMIRTTLATISALLALALPAQAADDGIAVPTLRASITVTSDVVRVGDLIDNAGSAATIAVYRSPDLGTTGALPVAQVLSVLRAKQVIGVMTGDIKEVQVTRLARTLANKDLETAVASALERRFGLGDAANISVTFDRGVADMRLDASNTGALQPAATRYDARSGRFDIAFEIGNDSNPTPTRLRFTGTAIETVEVAVLTRDIERADLLKSSDISLERRPKAEVTGEPATRERTIGMQLRRPMRAGTPIRVADIVKPDFVQRDQNVTIIYQVPGLYLTTRGKAMENGAEGDTVSVLNVQSKRTLTGVVTGRGQITVQGASQSTPMAPAVEQTSALKRDEAPAPVDTDALVRSLVQAPASPAQIAQAQIPQAQVPQVRVSQAPAKSE
jgi:flagella basal body P-ring formation protein FlgA